MEIRWTTDTEGCIPKDQDHLNEVHIKSVILDDKWVITGTSPLDIQSLYHSRESNLLIKSEEVAKIYNERVFIPIYKERSISYVDDNFNGYKAILAGKISRIRLRLEKSIPKKQEDKVSDSNKSIFSFFNNYKKRKLLAIERAKEKIKILDLLEEKMRKAATKEEVNKLIIEASQIKSDNILALMRTSSAEKEEYGETQTIKEIRQLSH